MGLDECMGIHEYRWVYTGYMGMHNHMLVHAKYQANMLLNHATTDTLIKQSSMNDEPTPLMHAVNEIILYTILINGCITDTRLMYIRTLNVLKYKAYK